MDDFVQCNGMILHNNHSLQSHNTFGLQVSAGTYIAFKDRRELRHFVGSDLKKYQRFLLLGEGSNILFLDDYEGLVMKIDTKGIALIDEKIDSVLLKAEAGENWNELVNYCVDRGYGGIENLAMIPGSAGAAPIQNIGAYGAELKDVIVAVEVLDADSSKALTINREECRFGYRTSVFKEVHRGRWIILSIVLRLLKNAKTNIGYNSLRAELEMSGIKEPGIQQVRDAVCRIRRSKLPDPAEIGNAGSFFKNPSVDEKTFHELISRFPGIITYQQADGSFKLAAGWLIEQCGWKGKRIGDAGVHAKQALVLVNYGNATGREIFNLSVQIQRSVFEKFGLELEKEVNVIE